MQLGVFLYCYAGSSFDQHDDVASNYVLIFSLISCNARYRCHGVLDYRRLRESRTWLYVFHSFLLFPIRLFGVFVFAV